MNCSLSSHVQQQINRTRQNDWQLPTQVSLESSIRLTHIPGHHCDLILAGKAKRFVPRVATYFGSGWVASLQEKCSDYDEIFINAILTGVQVRNLEEALGLRVLDRIGLIVNIFAQRARTSEAKLQVITPPTGKIHLCIEISTRCNSPVYSWPKRDWCVSWTRLAALQRSVSMGHRKSSVPSAP